MLNEINICVWSDRISVLFWKCVIETFTDFGIKLFLLASKFQMTSRYYKTGLVGHLTHCFPSHKKLATVACGNAPNSMGNSRIILPQSCFNTCIACLFVAIFIENIHRGIMNKEPLIICDGI